MVEYLKVSEELLPDLYEELDDFLEKIKSIIESQFDVSAGIIDFKNATEGNYQQAILEDPKVIIPFFQKVTGLPNREFERLTGEDISGLKNKTSGYIRKDEKTEIFIEEIRRWLPAKMEMNVALYTFVKMWEKDRRRHYRAEFESEVRETLKRGGYPNRKGENLEGKPDFVIPPKEEGPFQVIGEVRATHPTDAKKRVKEFLSEQEEAGRNHSGSKFVAVIKLPDRIRNLQHYRESIMDDCGEILDAVIFDDEFDELFDLFEEWGLDRQSNLQDYDN